MSDAAIEMENVVKVYPNGVRALDSVTLAIPRGSICAFLGRNGAGKSTAVRVLSTLSRKTSGRAAVCGVDIDARPAEVRRLAGVALQNSGLDGLMTAREHIELIAGLAGYRGKGRRQRADELLELVGLAGVAGRAVARYSSGMRRRLDLGLALIHRPQVLFLDELSSGLDLQSRLAAYEVIRGLRASGSTVFLATHDLGEADRLSDTVVVIDAGRICAAGSPAELKNSLGGATATFHLAGPADERRLALVFGNAMTAAKDTAVHMACAGSGEQLRGLLTRASEAGLVVDRVEVVGPSLEDVFVRLTGSHIAIAAPESGTAGIEAMQPAGIPPS